MVGLKIAENLSSFNLQRTTMGSPHYINDVIQCYMRYIGENNEARLTPISRDEFRKPIVAPTGSDEPFYYSIEANNGASDHSVFSDWAVRVPGIMLITWPDPYYHTSHDRPEQCDPTQLKRVVFLGVAAAYSIASAEDETAMKIATEIMGNAGHRLGHQLSISNNNIMNAKAKGLAQTYKNEVFNIEAIYLNEKETLETVSELFVDKAMMNNYLKTQQIFLKNIYENNFKIAEEQMKTRCKQLGISEIKLKLSKEELKSEILIPIPTTRVTESSYRAYSSFFKELSKADFEKYPFPSIMRTSSELQRLINGKRSLLDIKKMLDVQYPYEADMIDILNYIEILKLAGLVEIK